MAFRRKIVLAVLVAAAVLGVYASGALDGLTLEGLKARHDSLRLLTAENPWRSGLLFFFLYVAITSLSLPGAAVLTLGAGALFGFGKGLLLVSFASSLGATLAFVISRHLLRDFAEGRFGPRYRQVREGFERDGLSYLVLLRLVPVFPFFLVNIVMGLTRIPAWQFYLVSQIAMLPGTAVYVNAGTELGRITALSDILNARLLFAFGLLGVFPLLMKKGAELWRMKRAV